MSKTVNEIEKATAQLPHDQLMQLRAWCQKFDFHAWGEQIERDVAAGKLNALAEAAITDHRAGKTRKL